MSLVNIAMQLRAAIDNTQQKCFLAFGTLLFWVRDHQFVVEDDIDIGVIGDPQAVDAAFSGVFTPIARVVDDATGQPYQITYSSSLCSASIDVYFWKKKDGHYFHTYNHNHVDAPNGVLPEYEFKGIPASCFDVGQGTIEMYQEDIRYGRDMTDSGCWNKLVPQIPEEGIAFPLPFAYGWALDNWYPDWVTKRSQFGVSEAPNRFTVKSCKDIGWEA